MRRLTAYSSVAMASELQGLLEAAGIATHITNETTGFWRGPMAFVLWVAEDADPALIKRICASLRTSTAGQIDLPVSRVSHHDRSTTCLACGYDLFGQEEDGKCPECGHPYRIVEQKRCAACGVEMPDDFEICWRCGHELPPPLPSK